MFPGRRVFRVLEADEFDGRVSQEFRVKDAESGERGVSLLMGRLASGTMSECQAVLFDTKLLSELEAARWYQRNAHRFVQMWTGKSVEAAFGGWVTVVAQSKLTRAKAERFAAEKFLPFRSGRMKRSD